ncbi:hypothetical protein CspHIS471_0601480 [Cutaneotrichosporon sp. HIS471]|nr:hypothetical protein CspHIS471_0601480 [Cutaneotrichosporon sp. HIS471]
MSRYYTQGAGRPASPDEVEFADRVGTSSFIGGPRRGNANEMRPMRHGEYEAPPEQRAPSFDIRADFDGSGPRWSEMYGVAKQETYRPVYDHHEAEGSIGHLMPKQDQHNDPEMVTVPVLGAEWTKDELHGQSRRGKADAKADKRKTNFKAWNRDQRGCCGCSWMTRTAFVFVAFFFIAALIVTLYFVIPRAVEFQWYADQPFVNTTDTYFARTPANFTFDANLQLLADSSASYVPVQFSNAEAKILDIDTGVVIANGKLGKYTLQKGKNVPVAFPVTFSYAAINGTDPTWSNMYNACKHLFPGQERSSMKFRVEVKQFIVGMIPNPISTASLLGITCPFELPANGV